MKTSSLLVILCLFLNACNSGKSGSHLTPMPPNKSDPQDETLIKEVESYLAQKGAPANSQYDFVRVDLNNDRLRDGIVLFKTPYTHWCGWAGCSMAIFKADDNSFSYISDMINVRGPIYIGSANTNNYRDIVIRLSGTNMRSKNVMMKYDGREYPTNPLTEAELPAYINMDSYRKYFR